MPALRPAGEGSGKLLSGNAAAHGSLPRASRSRGASAPSRGWGASGKLQARGSRSGVQQSGAPSVAPPDLEWSWSELPTPMGGRREESRVPGMLL